MLFRNKDKKTKNQKLNLSILLIVKVPMTMTGWIVDKNISLTWQSGVWSHGLQELNVALR